MKILVDNIYKGGRFFSDITHWQKISLSVLSDDIKIIAKKIFTGPEIFSADSGIDKWNYCFITAKAEKSQYDILTETARESELPDKLLCFALSGRNFHGHHKRNWVSLEGNIHLSIHLKPNLPAGKLASGFIVLSAVSVLDTINAIPGLKNKAGIKWINDIVIGDSKVCGVLAGTQLTGDQINSAVLGIGLNVESSPKIISDSYVLKASCINEFLPENEKMSMPDIFIKLIDVLMKNYEILKSGNIAALIEKYLEWSVITGEKVRLMSDKVSGEPSFIHEGTIENITDKLELKFNNSDKLFSSGRIQILK